MNVLIHTGPKKQITKSAPAKFIKALVKFCEMDCDF